MRKILSLFIVLLFTLPLYGQTVEEGISKGYHPFSGVLLIGGEGGMTLGYTDYSDFKPFLMGKGYIEYYFPSEWSGAFGLRAFVSGGYIGGEDEYVDAPNISVIKSPFQSLGGGGVFTFSVSEVIFPYLFGGISSTSFDVEDEDGNILDPPVGLDNGDYDQTEMNYHVEVGSRFMVAHSVGLNVAVGMQYSPNDYWDEWTVGDDDDLMFQITAGASYSFFAEKDSDGDGVPDDVDQCPETGEDVRVNEFGCPLDDDGDGVPNFRDDCPNTEKGKKVDKFGCVLDSDGDGVNDPKDQCPNTPEGTRVNEYGCPDTDNDGVADNLDKCPDTPKGAPVTAEGCPKDSDGDNVPDYKDECPNTRMGLQVDKKGCPIMPEEKKEMVLEGDTNFEYNKATLLPAAERELDKLVKVMKDFKESRFRIAGHTDSRGSDEYNMNLSRERANAVVDYMTSRGIDRSRLEVKAYGESQPIASNDTDAGRAMNRRVEINLIEQGNSNNGGYMQKNMNNNMKKDKKDNNKD